MVTTRRARLTGMAVLIATFVVGALTGAATLQVLGADEAPSLNRAAPQAPPDLLDQLQLTAEQRARVDVILERRRAEMEEFWNEHRPTVRGIADSARAELRAVLTPEQQVIEERFFSERREREALKRERKATSW